MPEEITRRSHELLKQAIEIEESRWAAFVEERCNGNVELREKVMELLAAVRQSQTFLEVPVLSDLQRAPAQSHPALEQAIPGYRIVDLIGQGGMARVYEAIQERPHRRVALKVMNRGLSRSAVKRFEFETEVLARLRHPNIAQIFEAGSIVEGGGSSVPYFAMEYVQDARPVTGYADDQSLDLRARLTLCTIICDAVQHGHQNGVIHRDLKPGNVLVDSAGHPKVIDFGIARSTDPEQAWITHHTEIGQLIGTLNYMSPEQCAGAIDIDVRADVYSLGMILYELVCGRLPHDLTKVPFPEALRVVQRDPPKRPSSINPELRGDVEAIILKAIDKDPDRRYRTAAALAADIQRHLRHKPIDARPPTLFYQARLFAYRHRPAVIALAAIALSLVIGIVLSARYAYVASKELRLRKIAEVEAIAQRDAAVWQAYVANISAASAAIRSGELQYARRKLRESPESHRNWEWRFLKEGTERSSKTIQAHDDMILAFDLNRARSVIATGSRDGTISIWSAAGLIGQSLMNAESDQDHWVLSVSFNQEGTQLVSGSADKTIRLWNAQTGALIRVLGKHAANVDHVSFGKGGIVASASSDGNGMLWNAEAGAEVAEISTQPGGVHGVRFTSKGDRLVTWSKRGSVWVRSSDASEVLHKLEFAGGIFCATISQDDQYCAAAGAGGKIVVWNLNTGEMMHSLQTEGSVSSVRSIAFSPDGAILASGQSDRVIRLWSMQTGQEQMQSLGHEETISGLAFSADGFQLISTSWDRTMRIWDYAGPDQIDYITRLRGHTGNVISSRFSPDGNLLASSSSDGTVRLWDPELGSELATLHGHKGPVFALAFSPDGTRIASGSHDHTVRIWNATTGQQEAMLEGNEGHVWSVAFSPDGKFLATAGNDRVLRIWDLSTGKVMRRHEGHTERITCVQFSPDGTQIVSASRDHSVRIWDVASAASVFTLLGHRSDVYAVVFSPDGKKLFSGSRDQTVRIWDVRTGQCSATLDGHGQIVTCLSLNAAANRLAAGSWFGEVVLWDLDTLDVVLSIKAHEQVIRSVQFDPSGHQLVSASYDQTLRVFSDLPRQERVSRRQSALTKQAHAVETVNQMYAELGTTESVVNSIEHDRQVHEKGTAWMRKAVLLRMQKRLSGERDGI
jgi:eukaryotic-like serine/threonine-protein kinase